MNSVPIRSAEANGVARLNPSVRGLRPSATLAINERCQALRAEGRELCHFGFGQSPFPVPESVVQSLREHAHHKQYLPVQGLESLRRAVAAFHSQETKVAADACNVVIGPGSKELMFLLQLCFDGEVILPTPCWVSYAPQALIAGRPLARIHTNFESGWRLTSTDLERHCRQHADGHGSRLLVLNSPGNPTGIAYDAREMFDLAETARRWGVIVLADEIYSELGFAGPPVSLSRFYPEGTIISSGLSKWCGAGGWRLGTLLFPPELNWLREAVCAVASETYTTASAPVQYAAVTAFECGPPIKDYLLHCRRILQAVSQWMTAGLAELGVHVHPAAGGFYLFPNFEPLRARLARRRIHTSVELCDRLLDDAGVAMLPGAEFERPVEELTARCAFVDFDGEAALRRSRAFGPAQDLPESLVGEICPAMVRGLQRLQAFVAP